MEKRTTAHRLIIAGFPAFAYMFTVGAVGFWLPLYLQSRAGYSYDMLQAIATAYFAALSVGSLIAGMLSDKLGRPGLVGFTGMAGNAIVIVLMYKYTGYHEMILLRIIQGLSLSTAIPVALGSLSKLLGKSLGVGFTSLFMASGMALGSLIAGMLVGIVGYAPLFYLSAGVSLIASILSFELEIPGAGREKPRILAGLRKATRRVHGVVLGIFLRQLFATGVYAILTPIFHSILRLTILETGVILAVNPSVQGLSSIPLSRRVSRRPGIIYSAGIAVTGLVFASILLAYTLRGYGRIATLCLAVASMILQGLAYAQVNIAGNYIIIHDLPEEIRYTASSVFNLFFNLGWVFGTGFAGLYMRHHDPLGWVEIASLAEIIISIIIYIIVRD